MTDIKEILYSHIYPNVDINSFLAELKPVDKGAYFLCECPSCGEKQAYIYKGSNVLACNRLNKCGYSISLWDYAQQKNGFTNGETLRALADAAGYALPKTDFDSSKYLIIKEKAAALETANAIFKDALRSEKGDAVYDYLRDRGYSDDEISFFEAGFFPSQTELIQALETKGVTKSAYDKTGLATSGFGETHLLTLPYRDVSGSVAGFIVRAIDPEIKPKYKYSFGLEKESFFNINHTKFSETFVVVEGFFDALIASKHGFKGVVATGGAIPSVAQIENAVKFGAKKFVFALDSDEAGYKGCAKALNICRKKNIPAFAVELPHNYKDPDELIRAEGVNAFSELVKNAAASIKWTLHYIFAKHNLDSDLGKRDAKSEAIDLLLNLQDSLEIRDGVEIISNILRIDKAALEKEYAEYYKEKNLRERADRFSKMLSAGNALFREGDIDELEQRLRKELIELPPVSPKPLFDSYTFNDFLEEIKLAPNGLSTGFSTLDNLITIKPGAISIIAGRPRHGKTTLMLNMLLKMIFKYPEKTFFFFSYEEAKKDILVKALTILSGELISDNQNVKNIEYYLRGRLRNNTSYRRGNIDSALDTLNELFSSKRLKIIDDPLFVDDLSDALKYIKSQYDAGAVFIDYIQKIKIKGKYQSRQVELQKVSERILESAKENNLPIILGAQFNREALIKGRPRLENVRESGDIENDANTILGIYNDSVETDNKEKQGANEAVDFEVIILKNRNGRSNETVKLKFDRPILKIYEDENPFL